MPTLVCSTARQTSNMSEEEDTKMKETNTTVAPKWVVRPLNAFLAVLHVLVISLTLVVHPPIETGAARVLP